MQTYHLQNRPTREIKEISTLHEILKNGKFVIISMCRNNEPYVVTLSYGFDNENHALFFHCAKQGVKLDFIKENPEVCATVIEDGGYVINECEHNYRTLIIRGKMKIVSDSEEKKHGMLVLLQQLEESEDVKKRMVLKSDQSYNRMEILRLDIEDIQGKAGS